MKKCVYIVSALVAIMIIASCNKRPPSAPDPAPAVYYWLTSLNLDSAERDFLKQQHIKKFYLRLFDVVMRDGKPMPNATLKVVDSLPDDLSLIPTIFITENCLKADISNLPELLVKRVLQMCETNDLPTPHEIQIDCDWTRKSQDKYFQFLEQLRQLLAQRQMKLSATIRLHQMAMQAPPVDYGVLMVYNTGDVSKLNGHNPILDYRDVKPYLKHASKYPLPLCAAYPIFAWQLLYDSKGFKGYLHDENLNDSSLYLPISDNTWLVIAARDLPSLSDDASQETWVLPGDTVRVWRPTAHQVLQVSRALDAQRPGINQQVVLYSLDNKNIKHYTQKDYETIYHP